MTPVASADIDPKVDGVFRFWNTLQRSLGYLPGRQHFDPAMIHDAVPGALPHIWLLDIEPHPRRFRLRLIGSAIVAAGSPGRVGDYLDQHDTSGRTLEVLNGVVDSRTAYVDAGAPNLPHDTTVRRRHVCILPLARDGATVDMLLCCTTYEQAGSRPFLG